MCINRATFVTALFVLSLSSIAMSATLNEAARIQIFLDSRYRGSDVRHSFHTKFGETIDCIDFFAQPGVKALAAAGRPITNVPGPRPQHNGAAPVGDDAFTGAPDDLGHPRACPAGAVPILRIAPADILAVGGLDTFLAATKRKQAPPATSPNGGVKPPSSTGYSYMEMDYSGTPSIVEGLTELSIVNPWVRSQPNHSIGQTWTVSDGQNGTQTVEFGWNVDPALYNDHYVHLFIYSTNDGYTSTGCYNNVGTTCLPFVMDPYAIYTPGQRLTPSTFNGTQQSLVFDTANGDASYGAVGWNLTGVGVYPSTNYNWGMESSASRFSVGLEVFDQSETWMVPLGSGATPAAGLGQSASWNNSQVQQVGGTFSTSFTLPFSQSSNGLANYGYTTASHPSDFVGPLPNVFWGHDYGLSWNITGGDWAAGLYKGECGYWNGFIGTTPQQWGQPLDGISSFTDGTKSHAIHCGQTSIASAGYCYTRDFSTTDNRGTSDNGWDWDPGAVKGECAAAEYVAGVAQTTAGRIQKILCCQANVNHGTCNSEPFGNSNSSSFTSPDWDSGFFKGQCVSGKYVAGVSRKTGATHAVLCCSP